ncbi:MAG: VWA domain-containing protein [Synergistaceae bacterium]|jgi:uncharacterized protein YegL|nr:VWA domain-containing protein [Synergistaceae bacterium]
MKKGLTELVFILDKSGSMSGLESDTIGGYNSMLAQQRETVPPDMIITSEGIFTPDASDGECRVTTVLFDTNYTLLHDSVPIGSVRPITEQEYQAGGNTALLDAIGMTINKVSNTQSQTEEGERAEKVMFVIITDGEENSSREYSAEQVKAMIERQKAAGWEFIFLGANIDAVRTARRVGIGADRTANWMADRDGVDANFKTMDKTMRKFRRTGVIESSDLDDIRNNAKRRGQRE